MKSLALPTVLRPMSLVALLSLSGAALAQQRAPDWNQTTLSPSFGSSLPKRQPMQRMTPPRLSQSQSADSSSSIDRADTSAMQDSSALPEGYQTIQRVKPAVADPADPADQRQRSHLPEDSRPVEQQLEFLRRRVTTLIATVDDLQTRLTVSEQMLATHTHGYAMPNMGMVSVESWRSFIDRAERNGQPVPFFSGSSDRRSTSPAVIPK